MAPCFPTECQGIVVGRAASPKAPGTSAGPYLAPSVPSNQTASAGGFLASLDTYLAIAVSDFNAVFPDGKTSRSTALRL